MSKKEPKKWVIRAPVTTEEDIMSGKLACGCTCKCCFTAYKTSIEQSAYSAELLNALKAEKQAVNEAIKVVEGIEKENVKTVFLLKTEIKDLNDKLRAMEHNVEIDSKFRLGEKYAQEEVLLDNQAYKDENGVLRSAVMQLQADLELLIAENEREKTNLQFQEQKHNLLLSKMQQYEGKLHDYEMLNNDLRLKLTQQFDNQMHSHSNSIGAKSQLSLSNKSNAKRLASGSGTLNSMNSTSYSSQLGGFSNTSFPTTSSWNTLNPIETSAIIPRHGKTSAVHGTGSQYGQYNSMNGTSNSYSSTGIDSLSTIMQAHRR